MSLAAAKEAVISERVFALARGASGLAAEPWLMSLLAPVGSLEV